MRGGGGGGRRTAVAVVAAVLLAVVDVLAALDDHDVFSRRRRHRGKEIEVDLAGRVSKLQSETPWPITSMNLTDLSDGSKIIDRLMVGYNKHEAPTIDGPTIIQIGIYVNSFYSFSEQTMDFAVSMYLRQQWRDPRLAFKSYGTEFDKIRLGEHSWSKVWIPDTFFRNEKAAEFHEVTVNNRLMTLTEDGVLWYVVKISTTLSCPMKLQKYPLDTQRCPMQFESFGYTMDTIVFAWLENAVDIDKDVELPQFDLQYTTQRDCSQNYTAGEFPCLEIVFVMRRDIGYFLIQVYVPSILIVILSWVSFWINVDASPARVSLGLLTVLTTTTMSGGARSSLPRVSYIKAIDVWMIVCLVFVFASLIEYAVVNVLARRTVKFDDDDDGDGGKSSPRSRAVRSAQSTDDHRQSTLMHQGTMARSRSQRSSKRRRSPQPSRSPLAARASAPATVQVTIGDDADDGKYAARRVDKISRKCFPLAFLLFNLAYWILYALPGDADTSKSNSRS